MRYQKNIGFQEMLELMDKATDAQKDRLETIVQNDDWESYCELVARVLGYTLTCNTNI